MRVCFAVSILTDDISTWGIYEKTIAMWVGDESRDRRSEGQGTAFHFCSRGLELAFLHCTVMREIRLISTFPYPKWNSICSLPVCIVLYPWRFDSY